MSDADTELLSDDDQVLEQRRSGHRVQYRRGCEQSQVQERQQQQQQQVQEQPSMMTMMQALVQMQQTNQQMQQTQQQTTEQILQILEELQRQNNRFAAHEVRLQLLENGGEDRDVPIRYLRAVQPPEPAPPADAQRRRNARYTPDEDLRMVQYLIEKNKIDRAKSDGVWQEMRHDDPVIAGRTVSSLKHRFKSYVWPKVMAGQYTQDPQILHKFRRIWPERLFQAL